MRRSLDPAQVALPGGREHEERRAERGDAQVQRAPARRPRPRRPSRARRAARAATTSDEQREPDEQAQPQRLRAHERGLVSAPGAVQAGDVRGRAVGQEVEDRERGVEHGRGDRERGELRRPEVPDDRRVDEHVQRLGGERAERGQGEREDPAVVAASAEHGPLTVGYAPPVKLRLYHHHDGARVAYREAGTGPPLALLHSKLLSHREWEPLVEELSDRFRLILPDLPLHGDSEDRPRHPYTPDWLAEVMAGFCRDDVRPAAARRRPRGRRADAAARGRDAPAQPGAAGADAQRAAPPARARAARARGRRWRSASAARARASTARLARGARSPSGPTSARSSDRARQPRRARPRAPRVRRRRRQREPRPLLGARGAPLADRRADATCSTPTG